MASSASNFFTMTVNPITLSSLVVSNILQETVNIAVTTNSPGGSLYIAIRTTAPYGPGDANTIKNGTALTRTIISPPNQGSNSWSPTGLQIAVKHYVGVVQSLGSSNSEVISTSFTTIAYPPTIVLPTQSGPYPNAINYRDVPVHRNLLYGWSGTPPLTITVNRLPSGLVMNSQGDVSGTPDSIGATTGIITTVANNAGTARSEPFTWTIDRLDIVTPPPTAEPNIMNRANLFDLIKLYSDRFDADVEDALPYLLKLAEGRLSRMMRVKEMSDVWSTEIVDGREYYTLPDDFAGMRNIQYIWESQQKATPSYVNPEQGNRTKNGYYYTIITNRLRVIPVLTGSGIIELAYYRRILPLVNDADTNWLLTKNPDVYVSALMAEVEAFVKNDERHVMWVSKMDSYLDEINHKDRDDRWSGHSLSVKSEEA